jgi:hypothetical protein
MLTKFLLPAPLLAAGLAFAQEPREPIRVDTTTTGFDAGPDVATDGELSAILYMEDSAGSVHVATSDGRGLAWSPPIRIDSDTTGAVKITGVHSGTHTLHVAGNHVYATWVDWRNGGFQRSDVYFNRSLDGGATWQDDVRLDKGHPVGAQFRIFDWAMAVSPDPAGDHVYVLMLVGDGGATHPNELVLTASHDDGATFGPATPVSTVHDGPGHIRCSLDAEGNTVHLAWQDRRFAPTCCADVFYRKSTDGGVTFLPEVRVDATPPGSSIPDERIHVRALRNTVAILYHEDVNQGDEDLLIVVSTDDGATFSAPRVIGQYDPQDDTDGSALVVLDDAIVVTWDDNRTHSSNDVYATASYDDGVTWLPDRTISGVEHGRYPRIAGTHDALCIVFASQIHPDKAMISISRDLGFSWSPPIPFSDTTGFDADEPEIAFNELYGNAVAAWLSDDLGADHVYAGGVRPQTVRAVDAVAGGVGHFELAHFQNAVRFCWVLAGSAPGNLPLTPFGDPRDLGLAFGPLLLTSLANPSVFLTTLDGTGAGTTAPFVVLAPPGFTFYAAAVSFDVGPVFLAEISDVTKVVVE